MPSATASDGQSFSTKVGLLYVFNLIVGTGALALPRAFQNAGYVLGVLLLLVSAFTSYICATFIIECMSIANAVLNSRRRSETFDTEPDPSEGRTFEIRRRVEIGEMAHMFLGKTGIVCTYFSLSLYLFGDLAIYSTTVPKSLMNVICASVNASAHPNTTSCYEHWPEVLSRHNVYLLCVVAFLCACLPMVYIGMTKTKLLQLATTVARWLAFSLMIIMATVQLIQNGPQASPPAANFHGFGSLFGVAVYAFMCHHSLPGLITPMKRKSHVSNKLTFVYVGIFLFYCLLSITGSFTFSHVQDVYTLNFLHDDQRSFFYAISDYFLALFPVFTLTSSYIIVAISLSNNVKVLLSMISGTLQRGRAESTDRIESEALLAEGNSEEDSVNPSGRATDARSHMAPSSAASRAADIAIPLVVVLLPATISFCTDNVLLLASITGSYPGVGVQFVIPSVLAIFSRKFARKMIDEDIPAGNRSPFHQWYWPYVTLSWAAIAVIVVSINVFHLG